MNPPPGGSLPLRGRWTGRSPGRMREKQAKSEKQSTLNGSVFPFNVDCLVIGVQPLIRHALRRATFPVGEGCLTAGAALFQSVLDL